jgi:hypothetical protein
MKEIIGKIGRNEFMKAIKKGSREGFYEFHVGWAAKDRPHINKKKYARRKSQSWKNDWDFFYIKGISILFKYQYP